MAETLQAFPRSRRGLSRGESKYARYLDGQIWHITSADLGGATRATAVASMWRLLAVRGLRLRSSRQPDGSLIIQALPKEPTS